MLAVVKKPFFDLLERVDRKPGDVFECTPARFEDIRAKDAGLVEPAEPAEQPAPAEPAEPAKPARRKPAARRAKAGV